MAVQSDRPATSKLLDELARWHTPENPLYADEHACPILLGSEVVAILAEWGRNPAPLRPYTDHEAATKGAGG